MKINSFRFNLQELGGAFGDLGTLLPMMVMLILINGLNAMLVLIMVGLFYIVSGLYFRIPTPVQPLKAVAAIAISLGLSASVISAAGIIMGVILLFLSVTNLTGVVIKLFPKAVVRGIQLSIGLILLKKGIAFALDQQIFINGASFPGMSRYPVGILLAVSALAIFLLFKFVFFRQSQRFPPSLALLAFGLGAGILFGVAPAFEISGPVAISLSLPAAGDFWIAFTVLVIPQLPLTLGNAVVGSWDTARTYFKEKAHRMHPRALTTSMGVVNIAAGFLGAMPMCHGSGGLTAHYKLGARTGGSNLMIGGLLLGMGLLFGSVALSLFSLIPLAVLGVLLAIVGVYHATLIRDLRGVKQLAVACTVTIVTIGAGRLDYGFAAGIILYYLLNLLPSGLSILNRKVTPLMGKEGFVFKSADLGNTVKSRSLLESTPPELEHT